MFERIWNVTCEEEVQGSHGDHVHAQRSKQEVMLADLFYIVDLAGILLNKENPPDDSTLPFDEFQKFMQYETLDVDG